MKIAVFFDGARLARLGLEQAGHDCIGIELNPIAHYLSKFVGSGNCILGDVKDFNLNEFDACWASPPCQERSDARTQGDPISEYSENLLEFSLNLKNKVNVLWVENIMKQGKQGNEWGDKYNACQFLTDPIQNRNRIIGGNYRKPNTFRDYTKFYPGISLCVTATEYKGCASDKRRASRFYQRRLTIEECAYLQGFEIPKEWYNIPQGYTKAKWYEQIYTAIGNGVPVYMSKSFGQMYKSCKHTYITGLNGPSKCSKCGNEFGFQTSY